MGSSSQFDKKVKEEDKIAIPVSAKNCVRPGKSKKNFNFKKEIRSRNLDKKGLNSLN
jgi:hypothetical protein